MSIESSVRGYREVRELGSGASGRVVHAVHEATGTPVAVKYLSGQLLGDAQWRARFRDEARLLAGLRDGNIVWFYEYVEHVEYAAIVMELVDGVTLRSILDRTPVLAPEAALVLLKGSLLGLVSAHRVGVVHRDYKPANVLVDATGRSKLADFGVAVRADAATGMAGTPGYLAPEIWDGRPPQPATDVYAVTTTFFECLTGRRPFHDAESGGGLAWAHMHHRVPVDQVPEPVRGLVAAGLAKLPEQRPPSAADFVRRLEHLAGHHYGPYWEQRGRNGLAALAGALVAMFPLTIATTTPGSNVVPAKPDPIAPIKADPTTSKDAVSAKNTHPAKDALSAKDAHSGSPAGVGGKTPGWSKSWLLKAGAAVVAVAAIVVTTLIVVNTVTEDTPPNTAQRQQPPPPPADPFAGMNACELLNLAIAGDPGLATPELRPVDEPGETRTREVCQANASESGLWGVLLTTHNIGAEAYQDPRYQGRTEIDGRATRVNDVTGTNRSSPQQPEECFMVMDIGGRAALRVWVFTAYDRTNPAVDDCGEARGILTTISPTLPRA